MRHIQGAARCYTRFVPTTKPRHTITETAPVQEALDELRRELGEDRVELPDLVIRGARDKVREMRAQGEPARQARERLARRIREGEDLPDPSIADEAKNVGLISEI